MHHISKATAVITLPARTAFAVANAGLRTTMRLVGWAAEQAAGQPGPRTAPPSSVPVPRAAEPDVDPMEPTRTPPPAVVPPVKKAPAKKVPASEVPLKSAPTPSMPAGVEAIDAALEVPVPAPAKKAPAKKTAAKKTAAKTPAKKVAAKKAPSKQAAVLAPALGLSEDEVADVVGNDRPER
ncbi:hypothetical protein EUA06_14920 [Nocardioides glacieisoli]|uniref:Uncharacterized protein n=1 Tax=Nocardioides glacieisoli TaxID=1168730 RepID=A0A4Q2RM26_9ACTN|nr:hypothetical protein [Nocardioides glacieisoli]RYB89871.1 hypothetical protein EUA06_14920 [Nocardioides glacieisoli]